MAFRVAFVASLALATAEFASPVGKVVSLLGEIQGKIEEEGKAEDVKIAEYKAVCERRKADLAYQIKTAKSDIEEMSARSSKAQSKAEVAASTIGETQESLASNEADLKAATEVRQKESVDFRSAENELLDVNSALERAMSALEKEEKKGSALVQVKGAPGLLKAVQAMMDASMIGHEDAATLTNLLQNQDSELQAPAPAVYKSKSGGVIEMLEDMLDKSKDQVRELRRKESEAKHSFEMVKQSLEDEMGFAKKSLEKAQKIKAEQSRSKAEADKDLQQTKTSLAEDEQTLSDFVADCQQEVAAYEDETKSRALEMEALKTAKAALMESSGMSFLQLEQVHDRSSIRNSQDLKHFEVVRLVRSLGQKLGDHQLVLLSRRMDSMLRTEAGASADVFEKIKTMITDMIATMKENLQADATKKAYCDSEMGKASDKKATKEADMDSVSTKIDSAASKSASLKKEVVDINKELAVLAETEANMTKLRQEEKSLFGKKEPETLKGMEGVKTALRSLRDFYKASGVEVTSGERKGAAGGVISRLEDVEADMAMSLSQMRSSEKTAEMGFKKDMQDMKVERSQKEKDIQYKTQEAQRLDSELNNLNSDQESLETEMGALMEFTKGLEAECLVTPESFAEKQAKRQQEIDGLKEALDALDATSETPSLIQRQARVAFIQRLLVKEVGKRPLCREALGDEWFSGVEKQKSLSGRQARKARKSIANFAQMSFFSKAALNCVAAQLDTHKIENLAEAFAGYDADHDGRLSTAEFAAGLAEMGVDVDVIDQLVASVDMDCDGHINYTEFVAALLQVQGKLIDDVVYHAFQIFDLNGDGHISLDELRSMLSGGGPLSAVLPDGKTVEQALQDLDTSQDGVVSFDEFKAYLTRESQGASQSKSPEDSIEVDVRQSLDVVLKQLASLVGRPEAELLRQSKRLAQEHWITTVSDLKQLNTVDWPRLGLPLKLEQVLRRQIAA